MEQPAEGVNARREPIISQDNLRSTALQVTLREGLPQQAFRGTRPAAQGCLNTARRQIVTCENGYPTPYPRMEHIPKDYYVNLHFDVDEVWFIRNRSLLWGTYDALRQHDMV